MKPHFIFDMETMGQNVFKLPVIDCAYVVFDWDKFTSDEPYTFDELLSLIKKDKLDVKDQVKRFKNVIEDSTIKFWKDQSKEVRQAIAPREDDLKVEEFIDNLFNYLRGYSKVKYWWSRANTFDPIILQRMCRDVGVSTTLDELLSFWLIRDTRSHIDAITGYTRKTSFIPMKDEEKWKSLFKLHDSRHDVAADILRLQILARLDENMEIPE